jgi:hypothetical protein
LKDVFDFNNKDSSNESEEEGEITDDIPHPKFKRSRVYDKIGISSDGTRIIV